MNMLMRKVEPAPYAGELQTAVDQLAKILVPVDLVLSAVDAARDDRRAADAARDKAQSECSVVCRQWRAAIEEARQRHHGDPAEVQNARRSLENAEARCIEARKAFSRTRERQAAAFLRDVMPQIDQAAPVLLEVIRLLNDAMNPLAGLYRYTIDRNLPQPRLLASTPMMREATRILTAAINAATASYPSREDSDD
jgi:hypothetical protein